MVFFFTEPERVKHAVTWKKPTADEWSKGIRVVIEFFRTVKQVGYNGNISEY